MANGKLIFGCGYLGWRVAQLWHEGGARIHAVTRSLHRADEYRRGGLSAIVADITRPEMLSHLPAVDTVLFAVGFDRAAGPDIHAVYGEGMSNVLAALPARTGRLIYISTTGVYASARGGWVDEDTPPDPQRDGGRASLAAEEALWRHPLGKRSVILRLAGIYGPGRVPYLDKLRAGEPIAAPRAGWLNLIHVDDAARIVVAADVWAATREPADGPHVFCISDGSPVQRRDYYAEAARRIGAAAPTFISPPPDSPVAARAASNRRICNDKMRREFQVPLLYPSYREGLAAILGEHSNC